MKLIVHTDGGSRGNPGPAATGVVIERISGGGKLETTSGSGTEIARFGTRIGETTNNVAEYTAVIEAMTYIHDMTASDSPQDREHLIIEFYLDSTLVVNQLNGLFKVKDATLRGLLMRVRVLEQETGGKVTYHAIPREQNRRADFLVNQALDSILMSG